MLTDVTIRNAKPRERPYRLADSHGLYVEVSPAGGKLWRLKYRFLGAEKRLALGAYPAVGIAKARRDRDAARELLAAGIDPAAAKRDEKAQRRNLAADTFEAVAREWFATKVSGWTENTRINTLRRLEQRVFPFLGKRPIAQIEAPEYLQVLRRVEKDVSPEVARRVSQCIGQISRYAVATGKAKHDPTPALRGMLAPVEHKHMAAPTEPDKVGELLRMIEAATGTPQVLAALRLLPMLACRYGELRKMRWEDVDLDAAEWKFRVTKTRKTGVSDHIIPLASQAVAILRDLRPITGHLPGGWVFPNGQSALKPLSPAAANAAYKRLGIDTQEEITGHGWRSVLRTLGHERCGFDPVVIETALAHKTPDPSGLGGAYVRTRFIDQRRKMMQTWADYLDKLRTGADVIPLTAAA